MKLIIEIPEEEYKRMKEQSMFGRVDIWKRAIKNGTPLPEHHGRLIDADAIRKELWMEIPRLDYDGSLEPYEEGIYSAIMSLDDAPTIIEGSDSE